MLDHAGIVVSVGISEATVQGEEGATIALVAFPIREYRSRIYGDGHGFGGWPPNKDAPGHWISCIAIVREDMWKESNHLLQYWSQLTPLLQFAVAANRQESDLCGQSKVSVCVGAGLDKKHTVLVAQRLTQESLLGAPVRG